jgi:hypothetical protein
MYSNADYTIDLPDAPQIRGGARVMDLYLDSLFADFAVRRQIEGSLGDMDAFAERITPVLEHLHHQKAALTEERGAVETAMRKLIG